ncbi:AraC family transcriptional regulator [Limnoglobus roseus]|uniref:AraC family transcriptional regulator n=1 Tax=Limnoglobus roseus TaxID=2598579 RepID=A0A5C1AG07_9BACT|nr:AraC family transcriptional regulator [Limnoglobus roseus]QEL18359.1 AraC family transcriptional regulator [Limnoglobus roseus]
MPEPAFVELTRLVDRHTGRDGIHPTAVGPLTLYRTSQPSAPNQCVYEPAFCIVAQGSKQLLLGDEVYRYDPSHFLLVSVDLPVAGQVIEATPACPYLGLKIVLDTAQIGELIADGGEARGFTPQRGLGVTSLDPGMVDTVVRLLRLLDTPEHVRVLAPLALREITYRLLAGSAGPRLRQIVAADGQAQRIGRVIRHLKTNFADPLRIEDLAREAHMSVSALHHHFKTVTALSPLQYQKQLRLQEARRLLLGEGLDAAEAGYRVGYESPSQFSREYRRLFGQPPQRDVSRLKRSPAPAAV